MTFKALINRTQVDAVTWMVGEGGAGGMINYQGVYTAPNYAGVFHILTKDINNKWGMTTVNVRPESEIQTASPPTKIYYPPPTNTEPQPITQTEKTFREATAVQLQNVGTIIETARIAVSDAKQHLMRIVDQSMYEAVKALDPAKMEAVKPALMAMRLRMAEKIDSNLVGLTIITPAKINELTTEINGGLKEIGAIISKESGVIKTSITSDLKNVTEVLNTLAGKIENQSNNLKQEGGDLLYKDSNKDGISDYESVRVYNIDPVKPSPTTLYEGRKISASEKVLLGFDPTQPELIKIKHEEPAVSHAPVTPVYKVDEVKLTEEKKIILKGEALPNSFVTLYIYSTPIIVTVKTDSNGEWQYTLNKELENGEHTVYTATVNNSGKILAKSSGYVFTKTAEAATLSNLPPVQVASGTQKPGLLENSNFILILIIVVGLALLALILIGVRTKGNDPV